LTTGTPERSFADRFRTTERADRVGSGDYGVSMARPAALPPEAEPRPALLSPHTPRAIRDALVGSERAEFEHDYQQAMTEAARTLDLTEVLKVLDVYRELAEITQRQGAEAHLRMLEAVARLQRGQNVPVVEGHLHKAEISARLGR
jgi:uncharacterized protein (DUF2249 family)